MGRRVLEAGLVGVVLAGGFWLVEELRAPYSDLRLRLAELVDTVKGATP